MLDKFKKVKIVHNFSRIYLLIIVLIYIIYSFRISEYVTLFIDEKLLIDDIYNIWLFDDQFNTFNSVDSNFLKNILIFIKEFSYGGDLRYGRLWSNYFTIIVGVFALFDDQILIISTRILNVLTYLLANVLLVKALVPKKYFWIALLSLYSIPGVEMLNRIPKTETLSLLFISFGFLNLNKKKYYKSIFYFGIATFIKINSAILFIFISIYFFYITDEKKWKFSIKAFLTGISSLLLVNPILIIPPINIGAFKVPNFYKIYLNWLTTQSSNGDSIVFSFQNFTRWGKSLNAFYLLRTNIQIFIILLLLCFVVLFFKVIKNKNHMDILIFFVVFSYLIFYLFYIERQYMWYLVLPFSLFLILLFRNLNHNLDSAKKLLLYSFLIINLLGAQSNSFIFIEQKKFRANGDYGYQGIDSPVVAEKQIQKIIQIIENIYKNNNQLNNNLVYWNPNLFMPRNHVTYESFFYIREYWGNKDSPLYALEDSDIFVTYTKYDKIENVSVYQFENIYIYVKD